MGQYSNKWNGKYIVNKWYNKGIRNVVDLIDENGLIYEFQELKHRYDIPGTYLDYIRLINKYREGGEIW